jgi:hypothetical protein
VLQNRFHLRNRHFPRPASLPSSNLLQGSENAKPKKLSHRVW